MAKLTDMQIKAWIQAGEHFELRSDGNGLGLRYRDSYAIPVWVLRYSINGKQRPMVLGSYADLSLADARKTAKEMNARIALGYDVAAEKQTRKAEASAAIEAEKAAITVGQLADEYFERMILGRWKHPNIVRARIEKDIKPNIGKLKLDEVKPRHIDAMLQAIVKRGAPTISNDVLRWIRRVFDYGIKRQMMEVNPASAFDLSDAGGKEDSRSRALSRDDLAKLFEAMPNAKGFSVENDLSIKLLLLLCVRKMELLAARWDEFDLPAAIWHLPQDRTKTGEAIDIPLPALALEWLETLKRLAGASPYVLPARKMQSRMLPHVCESTLSVALAKVKHVLEPFTIHDLRRTARTHLAALGVSSDVAERCLNHKLKGVEGIYNQHDYFDERRDALNKWAGLLDALITGKPYNVIPIKGRKKTA
ncbi:MAG: tyrosine-type recombinase/integrase [Formivibrio sp.]|nr:tyrosine-type recombinase/integrase [Formivibrio sp.]